MQYEYATIYVENYICICVHTRLFMQEILYLKQGCQISNHKMPS